MLHVQVASFLQDERTLHSAVTLLVTGMRQGILAGMPLRGGGEDSPAAYPWQAVAHITAPLKTLPDPELQVTCSVCTAPLFNYCSTWTSLLGILGAVVGPFICAGN